MENRRKLKRKNRREKDSKDSSRKLKRIAKKTVKDPVDSAPRKIKRFKKQRCAFVDENKIRCKKLAVGKSTLCRKHGGNPIIKENLIPAKLEKDIIGLNTKYDPITHPMLFIDYSRMGMSEVEIAAKFEISVVTLKSWTERYEMFYTAYEIGKALHEAWWIQQGKSGLNNRGFNTSLFKFLTSNKLGYSDKMETKSMNMNVHGVLMIPDKISEEEWEAEGDVINVDS